MVFWNKYKSNTPLGYLIIDRTLYQRMHRCVVCTLYVQNLQIMYRIRFTTFRKNLFDWEPAEEFSAHCKVFIVKDYVDRGDVDDHFQQRSCEFDCIFLCVCNVITPTIVNKFRRFFFIGKVLVRLVEDAFKFKKIVILWGWQISGWIRLL